MADELPIIEIHTSDRGTFKRCRRKFGWGSTLRDNLILIGPDKDNFFIGTGFHFALEDYWGARRFDHPALAFAAYFDAQNPSDLPENADEDLELATGMLMYYIDEWLDEHPEPFETFVVDGVPQVEVEVAIQLNELLYEEMEKSHDGRRNGIIDDILKNNSVEYVTTYDRVVIDKHGRLFGLDYKTAKAFDELNLQTNAQAAAYNWSMDLFYHQADYTVEGMIWQQHKKQVPRPPRRINVGKKNEMFSQDKAQATTYRMYKRALNEHYGKGRIPEFYHEILATLANAQDDDGDRFVRRDVLRLNEYQREAEERKIIQEVLDMLDPHLPLYPNPTKDCSWDCPFKAPCLALDDGSDYEHLLDTEYTQWQGYKDDWRQKVKYPSA